MFAKDILFWNVDTQFDFMSASGKLYVSGAEQIQPTLKQITAFAKNNNIQVVNTADFHYANSKELSNNPDFITSFPPHCMANTSGAEYVNETIPETPFSEVFWNIQYSRKDICDFIINRNIVIRKDAFDVFEGNENTSEVLELIAPKKVFVYGVTTNVCVDCAVVGLAKRGISVYVIEDATKELPNIPLPFSKWDKLKVKRITFAEIEKHLN
ncbi:isochorismatase family protein [Labilibaculum sp. K2S]|uniref:cysteine hydrolase family protein n=1 Tax=Labilibaculum sp. K2S TaxID=3056386 RepID=UPI0025A3EF53|nr:isochorismatase family protein [Labilibaculum sp. K2S]MDM8162096.1 isochorismatase family protein [Labilibaculum sp. K2S]